MARDVASDAGVSHEQLEAGHAFAHQGVHFLKLRVGEIGDDAVKRIVGDCPAGSFLHPGVERGPQCLAFVLNGKIDKARGAPEGRGARSSFEIIRAGGASERHIEVGMHVDAAGKNKSSRSVDNRARIFARQAVPEGVDLAFCDGDIAGECVGRGDHTSVCDDGVEAHDAFPPGRRECILC